MILMKISFIAFRVDLIIIFATARPTWRSPASQLLRNTGIGPLCGNSEAVKYIGD